MLAIQALTFIAEEPERLNRFLEMTGLSLGEIRAAAGAPGFLAGILEHMVGDESLPDRVCNQRRHRSGRGRARPQRARQGLRDQDVP